MDGDKAAIAGVATMLLIILGNVAFWGFVAWAAIHFIRKFW